MNEKGYGSYNYKHFTIWSPGSKQWIAEPNWSIEAIENFKYEAPSFETIAKAKEWIRNEGIHLKEENFK